jgi:hypothetical protein
MGLFGGGGLFGKGKPVVVPPPPEAPGTPPIVGVVVPPATNATLRIFHTAWQIGGGVVCGLIAKKTGYVTTPADAEKVGVAVMLILATIKNVLVALKASRAAKLKPVA